MSSEKVEVDLNSKQIQKETHSFIVSLYLPVLLIVSMFESLTKEKYKEKMPIISLICDELRDELYPSTFSSQHDG